MRHLLSFLLIVVGYTSFSNEKIDSLQKALEKHSSEDAQKVDLMNQLGYEYWIINPVQSIIYGQQARVLADVLEYKNGRAFANRVIGVAHWARGNYDDGLSYLLDGLEMYRSIPDTLGIANCMMNIGLIYSDRQDNEPALSYFFEALKLFEEVKADNRTATTYVKLATIFISEGKYDAARDFLQRAWQIHKANQFIYGMSEILNRYGILMIALQKYDSATTYLNHSVELSKQINDHDGLAKNHIDLSLIAMKRNDIDRAEEFLSKGLIYARKIQSHKWLKELYGKLQQIARENGDLEKAIEYYDQYVREKDSIFNSQTLNNIARLETEIATIEQRRQLEAIENEIIILEQKSTLERTRFVIAGVILLVLLIGTFIYVRFRQKEGKLKEAKAIQEAEQARKELEFKNRELVSYTVNFVQKNQLFEELVENVSNLKKVSDPETSKQLLGMERAIKRHLQIDKDWEDFKLRFEHLHTGFFDQLLNHTPSLTNNDLKLSALVKMNFSIKEIADMMGISTESVKTARYRLKKKLQLSSDTGVNDFLNTLG